MQKSMGRKVSKVSHCFLHLFLYFLSFENINPIAEGMRRSDLLLYLSADLFLTIQIHKQSIRRYIISSSLCTLFLLKNYSNLNTAIKDHAQKNTKELYILFCMMLRIDEKKMKRRSAD